MRTGCNSKKFSKIIPLSADLQTINIAECPGCRKHGFGPVENLLAYWRSLVGTDRVVFELPFETHIEAAEFGKPPSSAIVYRPLQDMPVPGDASKAVGSRFLTSCCAGGGCYAIIKFESNCRCCRRSLSQCNIQHKVSQQWMRERQGTISTGAARPVNKLPLWLRSTGAPINQRVYLLKRPN
jgi:hypothetical protein